MLCGAWKAPPRPPLRPWLAGVVGLRALRYEVQRGAKGYGAVARAPLRPGDLVVQEAPTLCWADEAQLRQGFDALGSEAREAVWQLEDAYGDPKTLVGIARTNAFEAGQPVDPSNEDLEEEEQALYLKISRFNHSCLPNCGVSWDDREGLLQVFAEREISKGEDLCLYYKDVRYPKEQRQEQLKSLGFTCACQACVLADAASDRRRGRMQELLERVAVEEDLGRALVAVEELFEVYDEERLTVANYRAVSAFQAYTMCMGLEDFEGAEKWAQRAYEYSLQCHGPTHAHTKIMSRHASRARR